jgi:hypothetical protein
MSQAGTVSAGGGGGGGGANTFVTDVGTATPLAGVLNIITNEAILHCGSSVFFSGSGDTVQLSVTDGASNTMIGAGAGSFTISSQFNTGLGAFAGSSLSGAAASNTLIGSSAGISITTGARNTLIGVNTGGNYTSTESDNIILGYNIAGQTAETNTLRIGNGTGGGGGSLNRCFISGIVGITPSPNDGIPVFVNSQNQLGTVGTGGSTLVSTLTGNSGGAVSPTSGNINVVGDGTTVTVTGNPGTHTLTISSTGSSLSFPTDSGTATPSGGLLNIIASTSTLNAGSSVSFSGSGDTVLLNVTTPDPLRNMMVGRGAGNVTMAGQFNTAFGAFSGSSLTTGSSNTFIGEGAGESITSGTGNFLLGEAAGASYTSSESNNIIVGYHIFGSTGDSNVMRIGSGTGSGAGSILKAFVSGIIGITPDSADGIPVFVGSAGQLGTVGTGGSTLISSLVGDSGTATPSAGVINIIASPSSLNAGSSVSFSASGNTVLFNVTDSLNNTIIGKLSGSSAITGHRNIGLGYTCATGPNDGNDNIMIGYQTGAAFASGNNNIMIGSNAGFSLDGASSNILIGGSAGISLVSATQNIIIGGNAGSNLSFGGSNIFIGQNAGTSSASDNSNILVGVNTGASINGGTLNVMVGPSAGTSLASGDHNTLYGANAANGLSSGAANVVVGWNAGTAYTGSESSNIILGSVGVNGESNTLHIGDGTGSGTKQLNQAFISGIFGITVGTADGIPVFVGSGDQLGTVASTRRVKNSIEDMGDQSSSVLDLRPVTFLYNGDTSGKKQYGLIAEEVEEIFPALVARNKNGEIETVMYHVLPVLLLNEMKKQNELIQDLMARIKVLEEHNNE